MISHLSILTYSLVNIHQKKKNPEIATKENYKSVNKPEDQVSLL